MIRWCAVMPLAAFAFVFLMAGQASSEADQTLLRGSAGVEAVFEHSGGFVNWAGYRDVAAGQYWVIGGPRLSLQTADGNRVNVGEPGFRRLSQGEEEGEAACVVLDTEIETPPLAVRQTFSFCGDGRTLRIRTSLRALREPVTIPCIGLLDVKIQGQTLRLMGPGQVSSPVFGDRIFAGIEHPSANCQVDGDTMCLAQHAFTQVGPEWGARKASAPRVDVPAAVFGSASDEDVAASGDEALRLAFLRYLDTVRWKPSDMHVHYNDWWTAPVPSSEEFVLENIARLKRGLYDQTGFFFDSYALDAGWSDIHSVWEIDKTHFPEGFAGIRDALAQAGARPGLWISPSSLYPFTLDNRWLESQGYEVAPNSSIGLTACLAAGGKYQAAFKEAILRHARAANLAHVKFDGFVQSCSVKSHGHPAGDESFLPIAEGLLEVFDALRAQNPEIVLEPTCLGYHPSPWWLMHTPFVIGPFGDDSPRGRCPCPEWIESMTTARDIANFEGRDAFLMPSSALECFDIIVQCPGAFQNHAAMAVGRGRWFISSYINPKFMDAEEWRFFAELIAWARHNREFLQEPLPVGGNPADRQAYGYAFLGPDREVFCLRNPWIEEAAVPLAHGQRTVSAAREVRSLYPRREVIARVGEGESLPEMRLGPYETLFVEVAPDSARAPHHAPAPRPGPGITWRPEGDARVERLIFEDKPEPFGPSWTCPDGDVNETIAFEAKGALVVADALSAELCVLCERLPETPGRKVAGKEGNIPGFFLQVDGAEVPVAVSGSQGAFAACGAPPKEDWTWFTAPVPAGTHQIAVRVTTSDASSRFGVFLRGTVDAAPSEPPFDAGPAFPLYQADRSTWSRVLVPLTEPAVVAPARTVPRTVVSIDGVYLDALDWVEAAAGWGDVQRRRSVMGKPMTLGGRRFHRGIGAHAVSRIVYDVPQGHATFAATIGYDQEVRGGSIVFVILGDGKELFRSAVFGFDSELVDVRVPLGGAAKLTLLVEDAGDGITADHADWADARFLLR